MKKIYIIFFSFSLLLGLFWALPKNNFLTSNTVNSSYGTTTCGSVTHGDITWNFSSAVKCGQFANGEPWVVGPVTVTSISPAPAVLPSFNVTLKDSEYPMSEYKKIVANPDGTITYTYGPFDINGSMINPIPGQRQGLSEYILPAAAKVMSEPLKYDKSKNVALRLPNLILQANDVLLSSKYGGWPADKGGRQFLESVSALTVLPSVPPEGSFRPNIYGTDRTIRWNIDQINWSTLKNLDPVSGIKDAAWIYSEMPNLPWIEWTQEWDGWYIMPQKNTADGSLRGNPVGLASVYGKDISYKFGEVGLWLNTNQNIEDKKAIAIRMIQNGLDIYNYLQFPGAGFIEDGGHKSGRKLPLVMAAGMLNDGNQLLESKASNSTLFQEDRQTWFVTQADVGRPVMPEYRGYPTPQTYQQGDVGMAEWGIRHSRNPYEDNRNWDTGYRSVVWPAMTGPVLAAELMGLKTLWNHPAIFAYTERFYSINGAPTSMPFLNNMYIKYKLGGNPGTPPDNSPTPTPVTTLPFALGNRVRVENNTVNVRVLPDLQGTLRGTQIQGTTGVILDGPKQEDDITWWYMDYETGVDGWAGQDTHTVTNANVATPGTQYTLASTGTNGTITGNLGMYRNGTIAYLTATPNDGYRLTGWTGCTTSNGTVCEVTMTSSKTVQAQFEEIPVARVCRPWN